MIKLSMPSDNLLRLGTICGENYDFLSPRHRSFGNFITNLVAGLITYSFHKILTNYMLDF